MPGRCVRWALIAALTAGVLPVEAAPPELKTQGNRIVIKSNGVPVRLTGVNIPSLEWSPYTGEHLTESVTEATTSWQANIIRLPVNQAPWLAGGSYLTTVDSIIAQASAANAYVILDLHGFGQPDNNATAFWSSAANRYKNNPAVLFGLFNEPHGLTWEVWKNGNANGPGLQALVDTVRSTGANNIVLAGGLDWAYDLSGVINGHALSDPTGNGIVYDTHLYPWKSSWQLRVGNVAQQHPVLVGELGHPSGTSYIGLTFEHHSTWVPKALDWVDSRNLHWTGWSLHPAAAPSLISGWNYVPTAFWGAPALIRLQAYRNPSSDKVVGGTVIGTPGTRTNPGSGVLTDPVAGAVAAFNGVYSNYFDAPTANGSWTGLDLVTSRRITRIDYMPRQGSGNLMVGGVFQGSSSASFSSGVVTLFTVPTAPNASGGIYATATISNTGAYRYVRYRGPDGAYCNVASILFYTGDGSGSGVGGEDVIVDNAASSGFALSGTWISSTSVPGYYGSNFRHDNNGGKGSKSARFTPNLASYGNYEVFVRWTAHANRATNVPIDIIHAAGTESVEVNQQAGGGQWVSLGTHIFNGGTSGSVLIGNAGTNGYVIADAVRFVKQPEIIVDNTDPSGITFTGTWISSTAMPGYQGSDFVHDNNGGKGSKSVRFTPALSAGGSYEVFARWTSNPNRATNVPIDIVHGGGTATVQMNQQANGGAWISLGTFNFNAGTAGSVLIRTAGTNGYVVADAVKLIPQ